MIEHVLETGTDGEMMIRDNTDDSDLMNVEFLLMARGPVEVTIPWAYSTINPSEGKTFRAGFRTYAFDSTPLGTVGMWFKIHELSIGSLVEEVIFHLGDTGGTEFNGPSDLQISLYHANPAQVDVRIDGEYKKAVPYLKDDGEWKVVQPFVKTPDGWQPIT